MDASIKLDSGEKPVPPGGFPATRWSLVLQLSAGGGAGGRAALEELCRVYWLPLYWHARRLGCPPQDAEDVTQGFIASLLEHDRWSDADPARGRMRSYLLRGMENFLANHRRDASRQKRGSGFEFVSMEAAEREAAVPADAGLTPERAFDRRWVLTLLDRVMSLMAAEYESSGRGALFAAIRHCLLDDEGGREGYAGIAAALGMSEGAVKVAVHRLRGRYRERLVQEVADTVASEDAVPDELTYLMGVFAG